MALILNFGLAWVSVILAAMLAVIYILRRKAREYPRLQPAIERINRVLRRQHKILGAALAASGLIHGLYSSESVLSLNLGTIAWVLSVLLGLNWLFRKELPAQKGWMHAHRILTAAFMVILLMHLANVGVQAPQILVDSLKPYTMTAQLSVDGQLAAGTKSTAGTLPASGAQSTAGTQPAASTPATSTPATSGTLAAARHLFAGATLRDGTYEGVATGYGPGLTVSVVVKGGAVSSVQIVRHSEVNSRFYSRPIQLVPQAIVSEQRLDVDLVAGATFTSAGIVNAVRDALIDAIVSGTLPDALSLPARGRKR